MSGRLPDRIPEDVEVVDVDLDATEVTYRGRRLTEARAAELGQAVVRRTRGRPSLSGSASRSPTITLRVTAATRASLEDVARRQGRTVSDVARDALDDYIADHADTV